MPRFPRSWFPRPWSKKRGKRILAGVTGGVVGEAAFYMSLFLIGVFVISLVLINRFAPGLPLPGRPASMPGAGPGGGTVSGGGAGGDAVSTSLGMWIFGVLGIASVLCGAGGLLFRLMRVGASNERRSAFATRAGVIASRAGSGDRFPTAPDGPSSDDLGRLPNVPRASAMNDSPGERLTYRLAAQNPESGILGPATLALLWNAVWFILLAVVVSGFWYGRPRWILAGLLVPFAIIGVWAFRFFQAQLRKSVGVGSTIVEISDHPLVPGGQYDVFICQTGRLKLRRLTVQLTCEEETFYRQGTDVRVDRHESFTQVLVKERDVRVDPMTPWEQQLPVQLPANVMHSFVGTHNAIRWKIVVSGESHPWPSFCRSFPVVVHPPGLPVKRSPR